MFAEHYTHLSEILWTIEQNANPQWWKSSRGKNCSFTSITYFVLSLQFTTMKWRDLFSMKPKKNLSWDWTCFKNILATKFLFPRLCMIVILTVKEMLKIFHSSVHNDFKFFFALLVILRHFGYFCVPRATQTIFVMTKPKNLYFCNSHNNFLVLKKIKNLPKRNWKNIKNWVGEKSFSEHMGGKSLPEPLMKFFSRKFDNCILIKPPKNAIDF